jgi:hypothetical protein
MRTLHATEVLGNNWNVPSLVLQRNLKVVIVA